MVVAASVKLEANWKHLTKFDFELWMEVELQRSSLAAVAWQRQMAMDPTQRPSTWARPSAFAAPPLPFTAPLQVEVQAAMNRNQEKETNRNQKSKVVARHQMKPLERDGNDPNPMASVFFGIGFFGASPRPRVSSIWATMAATGTGCHGGGTKRNIDISKRNLDVTSNLVSMYSPGNMLLWQFGIYF